MDLKKWNGSLSLFELVFSHFTVALTERLETEISDLVIVPVYPTTFWNHCIIDLNWDDRNYVLSLMVIFGISSSNSLHGEATI